MAELEKEQSQQAGEAIAADDFQSLLNQEFKPKSEHAESAVSSAVNTLAEEILKRETNIVKDDAVATINAIIAEIDEKLTAQVNEILHHDEFQKLESAWRGLHHLVNNTETDEQLKIRVMNISKNDLGKNIKKFKGMIRGRN